MITRFISSLVHLWYGLGTTIPGSLELQISNSVSGDNWEIM